MDYTHVWVAIIASSEAKFPVGYTDEPKQFRQPRDNIFVKVTQDFISLGVKPTQIVIVTASDNQTELARQTSSRVYQVGSNFGYAEAIIKTAEFIEAYDKNAIIINAPVQYLTDEYFAVTIEKAIRKAQVSKPTIIGVEFDSTIMATDDRHAVFKPDKKTFSADELRVKLGKLPIAICNW